MTMTSKFMVPRGTRCALPSLPDAELREDLLEHIFARDRAGEKTERGRRAVEIDEHDRLFVAFVDRHERGAKRALAFAHRDALPLVHQASLRRGEVITHQLVEI